MKYTKFIDHNDGTVKYLFKTEKGPIEISHIKNKIQKGYDVLCLPTHYFCDMGCVMCHLTNIQTNLKPYRISYETLISCINEIKCELVTKKILLSFMGVGDASLNMSLIKGFALMGVPGFTTSISISTAMFTDIEKDLKFIVDNGAHVKVHYSLHSTKPSIRNKLIPSKKTLSVHKTLWLLKRYQEYAEQNIDVCSDFKVFHNNLDFTEFHYTLMDGINDSIDDIIILIKTSLVSNIGIKFIQFNEKDDMEQSKKQEDIIQGIKHIVKAYAPDIRVKFYIPPGKEVGSSCGCFDTKIYKFE